MKCEYGCGKKAKYQLKNGKWCCSKSQNSCSVLRNKNRISNTGKKMSDISNEKNRIKHKNSIKQLQNKYSFFSQIEEMRYNPNKPGEKEIQIHCKNHNCSNSKEQGGWFTPTYIQLYERIRQLEKNGNDGCYFYCSDECKIICPLYKSKGVDPFKSNKRNYLDSEYQQFREFVLERDNYECQYCGEKAEHVHHERPQKLEPFHSLDPDYAWSCCSKCHYKKGHKDECSLIKISQIKCTNA